AKKLSDTLKHLSLRVPQDAGSAAQVSGKKYAFPANDRKLESVTLTNDAQDGVTTLVMRIDGAERRLVCGRGAWQKGRLAWASFPERPMAASGAWTGDGTYTTKICFYETPFVVTVVLKFSGDEVRFSAEPNVGFGSKKEPELVGKQE
ncbi:MAG TPA: hypothetical protein PK867_23410, partial [Pirellulales bacterium]|nr:hypothetical protein [Pirellulales bacterium]